MTKEQRNLPPTDSGFFPIKEVLASLEKKQPYKLLEFDLDGETYTVLVVRFGGIKPTPETLTNLFREESTQTDETSIKEYATTFSVRDKANKAVGTISGNVLTDGEEFVSFAEFNLTRPDATLPPEPSDTATVTDQADVASTPQPIKGLIKETVIQILLQHKIDTWYSSAILTKGGQISYTVSLPNDGRVVVDEGQYYDGQTRYRVRLKNQSGDS